MNKFDKEYYRKHRFYSNKYCNVHAMLENEHIDSMIEYNKNMFYVQYPQCIMEDLAVFEEELAKVNAYKEALEEGIALFKEHYL